MKVLILAQDEVLRLFSTRRGLISLFGFCLVWVVVLIYGILPVVRFLNGAAESGLLDVILPRIGVDTLQLWPSPELSVYWFVSLSLLPILSLLISADQTASDRARGTLRYLVMRSNRLEIFFGRFFGQLFIMLSVVFATLVSVLVVIAFNSAEQLQLALLSVPAIIVNLVLVLAPFIALMAMVSVIAKSARQATMFAVILWILASLILFLLNSNFPNVSVLQWALPGSQISDLYLLAEWDTLALAPIPLIHTLVLLAIGAFIMKRRDL